MTNVEALRRLSKMGYGVSSVTQDGHVIVRGKDGRVLTKMRQTGDAHIALVRFIQGRTRRVQPPPLNFLKEDQ